MPLEKGTKPLITDEQINKSLDLLKEVNDKGVPTFIRNIELKEKAMAKKLLELAKTIAHLHSKRIAEEHGITLSKAQQASFALDAYILAWFSIICLDRSKDFANNFEEWMHKMTGGEFLDS